HQQMQLYLGMLTVSPEIQSRGIGKQLLQAAEKYGLEKNCTVISMTVIDTRNELIDWYKRHGYNITGETRPFPADPSFGIPKQPIQFLVLEKKIGNSKHAI
ncbi:MAG: GNAT family N-acetyltransferase, partial [Ferruginibacter sp.]